MPPVIRATERRHTKTPTGVMTTHASPTLGTTAGLSLWQVTMTAGASGPLHTIDSEQIWTVLDGQLSVTIDDTTEVLDRDDTIVIPQQLERQVNALTDVRLLVCGHSNATARIPGEATSRGTPAWIA